MKAAWILFAVLLFVMAFLAYTKHRMTEEIGLGWFAVAIVVFFTGIALQEDVFLVAQLPWLFILAAGILLLFGISVAVSGLIMKNRELAMQVSLLNQENERILHMLGILSKEKKHDESEKEAAVRD